MQHLPILFTIVISISSATISFFLYKLNIKALKDNHDYNRRQCALRLIENWDKDTIKARRHILNKWKEAYNSEKIIDYKEIMAYSIKQKEEVVKNGKNPDDFLSVTDDIQIILNYFENLALGIDHNIAEEKVIKQAFYSTLNRWYVILTDYREHVNRDRKFHPWKALENFHEKWYEDPYISVHKDKLPPTGNLSKQKK
jgi:hypothetical protein